MTRSPGPSHGGGAYPRRSRGKPDGCDGRYAAFTAWTSLVSESLASPKSMVVFGS